MPSIPENLNWVTSTATLIYGKKDAVLIDTFMTIEQSNLLNDWIAATGKNLKHIYITHGHVDHFLGIQMLLDRFPNAKAIATKGSINRMEETLKGGLTRVFTGPFPEIITLPQVLEGRKIELEGNIIQVIETGFTDTRDTTSVYVPSIGLGVGGDVVYNGIHPYLFETTKQTRQEWRDSLDKLASLNPSVAIASHKNPDFADSPYNIPATKKYLEDFEKLNDETSSEIELFNRMLALYPDRANPVSLWSAAKKARQV